MGIQKTITPIDNSIYIERPIASDNEINDILDKSHKSFSGWKNTSIEDRKVIINKFIDNLISLKEEVSKEICWQQLLYIEQLHKRLEALEAKLEQ